MVEQRRQAPAVGMPPDHVYLLMISHALPAASHEVVRYETNQQYGSGGDVRTWSGLVWRLVDRTL